jgi:Trk K+ transport system NAD-binding subunit
LSDPVYFREGHWVLCSFGRFGKELFRKLAKKNIRTTIIEASGELRAEFESMPESEGHQFITGTGFDAETLTRADIQHSAGLIAGTDNDSNNLSIIMTARALNKDVFVVARQNQYHNHAL